MAHQAQKGFTLVELAIALMVIGLLIGGVLKGQELIENARVTAFAKQIKEFDTAVMIFRNTYGAFPGDIKRPNRIPNCTEEICIIGGNGNGRISMLPSPDNIIETYNFFPHLTKAGMLQGPPGGTEAQMETRESLSSYERIISDEQDIFFPKLTIGYIQGFANYSSAAGDTYYPLTTTAQMARIDAKMDDGMPYNGSVRTEECATVDVDGRYEYDLTVDDFLCGTWVGSENWRFE